MREPEMSTVGRKIYRENTKHLSGVWDEEKKEDGDEKRRMM